MDWGLAVWVSAKVDLVRLSGGDLAREQSVEVLKGLNHNYLPNFVTLVLGIRPRLSWGIVLRAPGLFALFVFHTRVLYQVYDVGQIIILIALSSYQDWLCLGGSPLVP